MHDVDQSRSGVSEIISKAPTISLKTADGNLVRKALGIELLTLRKKSIYWSNRATLFDRHLFRRTFETRRVSGVEIVFAGRLFAFPELSLGE